MLARGKNKRPRHTWLSPAYQPGQSDPVIQTGFPTIATIEKEEEIFKRQNRGKKASRDSRGSARLPEYMQDGAARRIFFRRLDLARGAISRHAEATSVLSAREIIQQTGSAMVLNRRIADSSLLAGPRIKIKQGSMETISGPVLSSRSDRNVEGKRWQIIGTRNITAAPNDTILDADATNCNSGKISGPTVPSFTSSQRREPTTHQRVQRILEDHAIWQDQPVKNNRDRSSRSSSTLASANIVASRGESSRRNFSPSPSSEKAPTRTKIERNSGIFVNGREDSGAKNRRSSAFDWEKRAANRVNDKSGWRNFRDCEKIAGALPKSSSIPANLKSVSGSSGGQNTTKCSVKKSTSGILRKSSAFLAGLASSTVKNCNGRKSNGNHLLDASSRGESRFALSRRDPPFVTYRVKDDFARGVRRSPSCQNLSETGKGKNNAYKTGVKKSVSFSSDTSFEEKRAPFVKTAVHEAKVYRKGVLRDINATERPTKKLSESWELAFKDPKALLEASREADEQGLRELVSRIRKFGLGQMDVNATDSSGRTAISHLAGNGSPTMLEAALSFTGCDPNLPDNEGNTPLHFAAQAGQAECLNILLRRCSGIEVDARNVLGFTPLMKAALQGRTKCAKILLLAGANPTMRDHGKGLRAEQWARYCGRQVCADIIERFARRDSIERDISCRWGSEPELATKVLQGKVQPISAHPLPSPSMGLRSRIKRVFRTTSGPDRSFSLVSQLTNAALCASSPALPRPGETSTNVESLVRPLSVPQLRVTLAGSQDAIERSNDKRGTNFAENIASSIIKPPRTKKKNK